MGRTPGRSRRTGERAVKHRPAMGRSQRAGWFHWLPGRPHHGKQRPLRPRTPRRWRVPSAPWMPVPRHPPVSVIIPVLNEELHLDRGRGPGAGPGLPRGRSKWCWRWARAPTTPMRSLPNWLAADPRSGRCQPVRTHARGLNAAIAASRHEIVVRVDGHAILPDRLHQHRRPHAARDRCRQRRRRHGRRGHDGV